MKKRWRQRGHRLFEQLEERRLLSTTLGAWQTQIASVHTRQVVMTPTYVAAGRVKTQASSPPASTALTPQQIRGAYGIDQVMFGSVTGDGSGQTIAIIDAYHYPSAYSDLQAFDAAYSLPDLQMYNPSGNTGPYFRQVAQDGSTNYPSTDPASKGNDWEVEEALDIEWAHAIAPGANIILVEANDATDANLIENAVNWARSQPGVSAISMSFSGPEGSGFGQTTKSEESILDPYFTTPTGHTGITFLAATGDSGQPSGYPAYSPTVVAVGGTSLTVSGNSYASESGWSDSGGGPSIYESQPTYQNGIVTQTTTARANPDVSMDADPNTGVLIYDTYDFGNNPWQQYGGTSLATPMWAGVVAIADQGRVANGLTPLDGATQLLPRLYQLAATDFHDVTSGNNGYSAGVGYDYVTGRGTPTLQLINDLAQTPAAATATPTLAAVSDTGVSNSDRLTDLNNSSVSKELQFTVGNTIPGATVSLLMNGNVIGSAVASGSTTTVTTNGTFTLTDGAHAISAVQTPAGQGQSAPSGAVTITVDTVPPAVLSQSPNGPVSGSQSSMQLTFNSAMNPNSFTLSDITSFTDPNNNDLTGQITGFAWSGGNTILTIQFNSQSTQGSYQMTFSSQISDAAGNFMTAGYSATFSIITAVYSANMTTDPGWTFDAGSAWAWGTPMGGGSHNHDPSSGHTGTSVIGYNLSGDYTKNITYYATTPVINASNYQNLTLSFWRWLGVRMSATASVQASPDGGNTWVTLWTNNGSTISDSSWSQQKLTLPASFNNDPDIKIRWGMGPTGQSNTTYPGWNIDDVLVTGTPAASISGQVFVDANGNGTLDSGETGVPGATVFLDTNNNGTLDPGSNYNFASTNVPLAIPDNNSAGVTSSLTVANTTSSITSITITFNITHTSDSDLIGTLTAPDGTSITLFSRVGGSGNNFNNTTLSDSASTLISSGSPPFSGTFKPSPGTLSTFNGKSANGTWTFNVADVTAGNTGTLNSWSLAITTGPEPSTTTDANGNYTLNVPTTGTYTVREILPANYVATTATSQSVPVNGPVTGENFGLFPTNFTTNSDSASYYLSLDASGTKLQINSGNTFSATPTYQVPLSTLSSLTFNLLGASDQLTIDYTNGTPLPTGGLTFNAATGSTTQLTVLGNDPSQSFSMTDTQIARTGSSRFISFNNVYAMTLQNMTVHFTGTLSTIGQLNVLSGANFIWEG